MGTTIGDWPDYPLHVVCYELTSSVSRHIRHQSDCLRLIAFTTLVIGRACNFVLIFGRIVVGGEA